MVFGPSHPTVLRMHAEVRSRLHPVRPRSQDATLNLKSALRLLTTHNLLLQVLFVLIQRAHGSRFSAVCLKLIVGVSFLTCLMFPGSLLHG